MSMGTDNLSMQINDCVIARKIVDVYLRHTAIMR